LREYVPLRIVVTDVKAAKVAVDIQRSQEILNEIWTISEGVAKTTTQGDLVSTYLESLNETIDLNEPRITAGLYARVPETVLLLLVIGSTLSIGMVGYSAGLTKRRALLNAFVLVIALGAVIMIIVDLDRPREGFIQVSQQPLIDLQRQIGPPRPRHGVPEPMDTTQSRDRLTGWYVTIPTVFRDDDELSVDLD